MVLLICWDVNHQWRSAGKAMGVGGHTGASLASSALAALAEHPGCFLLAILMARCAAVGGDGQICGGGPNHRHQSSRAAERFWQTVHPGSALLCVMWGRFHRLDIGMTRAIKACAASKELFDMSAATSALFGIGEGQVLWRGLSELLEQQAGQVHA